MGWFDYDSQNRTCGTNDNNTLMILRHIYQLSLPYPHSPPGGSFCLSPFLGQLPYVLPFETRPLYSSYASAATASSAHAKRTVGTLALLFRTVT